MVQMKIGNCRDLIIHPGETLKETLEERCISQEELANRTGFTPKHISEVINGKKGISPSFAKKLEYVFPLASATFWLNLQQIYDLEIEQYKEENSIDDSEYIIFDNTKDIYNYSRKINLLENVYEKPFKIIDFRKLLNISNLNNICKLTTNSKFRKSKKIEVDEIRLYAWTKVCEKLADVNPINEKLNIEKLMDNLTEIKNVMFSKENEIYSKLREIFSMCGINFNIVKSFKGIPVQGFIKQNKDQIYLFITLRGKYADIFWFTLFHEIGHILNLDFQNDYIDFYDSELKEEEKADSFARTFLIDDDEFKKIKEDDNLNIKKINEFAKENNIKPYIVIGRLQKELNNYKLYSEYKDKYNWLDN